MISTAPAQNKSNIISRAVRKYYFNANSNRFFTKKENIAKITIPLAIIAAKSVPETPIPFFVATVLVTKIVVSIHKFFKNKIIPLIQQKEKVPLEKGFSFRLLGLLNFEIANFQLSTEPVSGLLFATLGALSLAASAAIRFFGRRSSIKELKGVVSNPKDKAFLKEKMEEQGLPEKTQNELNYKLITIPETLKRYIDCKVSPYYSTRNGFNLAAASVMVYGIDWLSLPGFTTMLSLTELCNTKTFGSKISKGSQRRNLAVAALFSSGLLSLSGSTSNIGLAFFLSGLAVLLVDKIIRFTGARSSIKQLAELVKTDQDKELLLQEMGRINIPSEVYHQLENKFRY